jgi:virginiamycin A acetyltransferase
VVKSKSTSGIQHKANSWKTLSKISVDFVKLAREKEKRSVSSMSRFIMGAYSIRIFRRLCLALVRRVEGGEMHSTTLRCVLSKFERVTVGRYSYGDCLVPGLLLPGTSVGNYCSVAEGLRVFRRNHPVSHLSLHPFFYNAELGFLVEDTIENNQDNPLHIGHDVWIGAGVTILPGCKKIGNGAVIGAGSVVTHDVSPFSIVAGNPARHVRDRFSPEIRDLIEQSRWWDFPLSTVLVAAGDLLYRPIDAKDLSELKSRLEHQNVPNS